MTMCSRLAPACQIDWDAFKDAAVQDLKDTLLANPEFNSAQTLRTQVFIAYQILHPNHIPAVPLSVIGRLFQVSKNTIRDHVKNYKKYGDEEGKSGRRPILPPEAHEQLIQYILESQAVGHPRTMGEIREYIEATWEVEIDRDTVWRSLARDPRIKSCDARPMEDKRLAVTDEQIEEHFHKLVNLVSGVPAHFVFNMDEMGHQDWADRQTNTCYVSSEVKENYVYVPVSRTGRRITLVTCIAADGSSIKPLVIIPNLQGLPRESEMCPRPHPGICDTANSRRRRIRRQGRERG
jgi:hypothetical protein